MRSYKDFYNHYFSTCYVLFFHSVYVNYLLINLFVRTVLVTRYHFKIKTWNKQFTRNSLRNSNEAVFLLICRVVIVISSSEIYLLSFKIDGALNNCIITNVKYCERLLTVYNIIKLIKNVFKNFKCK